MSTSDSTDEPRDRGGAARNGAPLLALRGLTKRFGPVQALTRIDFDVPPGQVTALAGDNGAGKSVTIKTIAGLWQPDEGQILWEGKPVHFHGPRDAEALGITTIYQDLALCDNLDIVQNMFLGHELLRRGLLDEAAMEITARETLDELHVTTIRSIRQPVASLSGGQRQSVAVAKAVMSKAKLVIMDEPTAALGVAQTRQVLEPDQAARLAGGRGARRLAQPERRLRGRGPDRDSVPRARWSPRARCPSSTRRSVVDYMTTGRSERTADHASVPHVEPDGRDDGRRDASSTGTPSELEEPPLATERVEDQAAAPESDVELAAAAPEVLADSLGEYLRAWGRRIRSGESGALPIVVGLIVIIIFFQVERSQFDSAHQPRQPVRAGVDLHPARRGRDLRADPVGDRPVGRLRARRRRFRRSPS